MSETPPRLSPAVPVLRIFSQEKAREFYLDFLGFRQEWEHRFGPDLPLYMQIARSDLVLHLSEHHGDAAPGSTIFVPMLGIDALARELSGWSYAYARPAVEDLPWGRQIELVDPFGNRLRLCERRP